MFVMGKFHAGMVWRVVPTDLQLVASRQPVVTVAFQYRSVPLFSKPEISAIWRCKLGRRVLAIKFKRDDPLEC